MIFNKPTIMVINNIVFIVTILCFQTIVVSTGGYNSSGSLAVKNMFVLTYLPTLYVFRVIELNNVVRSVLGIIYRYYKQFKNAYYFLMQLVIIVCQYLINII